MNSEVVGIELQGSVQLKDVKVMLALWISSAAADSQCHQ